MSHSSLQSIYRQINKTLVVLSLVFVLFIVFLYTAFHFNSYQNTNKKGGELSQLTQQVSYQQVLIQTSRLLEKLINAEQASHFQSDHQQLMKQWNSLNSLLNENSLQFDSWLLENKKKQEIIVRISSNSEQNIQLLATSIEDIRLILVTLEKSITKKSRQRQQMYQLVLQGGTNDSVTINRAKSHVKFSAELEDLQLLQQEFTALELALSTLNVTTPSDQFELITQQVTKIFVLYEFLLSEGNSASIISDINEQVESLKLLLINEQRVIAKWRGHLRLINLYRETLLNQYQMLEDIILHEALDKNIYASAEKVATKNWLSSFNKKLSLREQLVAFWLVVCLFICLFIYLLMKLSKIFKLHHINNIAILSDSNLQADSIETQHLASLVVDSANEKLKPSDEGELLKNYQQQVDILSKVSQAAYWQLPYSSLTKAQQQALPVKGTSQKYSWRAYFTKQGVRDLIAKARLAKKDNCRQQLTIKMANEQDVVITLYCGNGQWYGTLADAKQSGKLERNIHDLEIELIQQNKDSKTAEQHRNNKLNEMLIQIMLQSQNDSISSACSSAEMYRQLTCILGWLRQKQLVSHLQIRAKTLSLSNVYLVDEIHAAIVNAASDAQYQKNKILLNCDLQLMSEAKLDARLFQRLVLVVCRILLQDQTHAHLQFSVQVVDKNAGQQIIKISASVNSATKLTRLPEHLSQLLFKNIEQSPSRDVNDITDYFHALLQCQHGSNLDCQMTEQGYFMSFELPLAIVNQQIKNITTVNFNKSSMLLISKDEGLKITLGQYIKNADGLLQTSASCDYFIDDLTLDLLKRRPIKLVILSSDCYDSDFNKVTEHINSLPQEFQPKLMVMQGSYRIPLQQQGLYTFGNYPLSQGQFLTEVSRILSDNKETNILLEAQQCQSYQYSTTQVEVLFAVKSPEKHQPLLRVLHWLGLQVQVVSQAQAMKKHWQTGRYLVLLNEFSQTPFITMTTGAFVQRGVFSFSAINKEHLSEQQLLLSKMWQVGTLPEDINLAKLTTLLSPWLNKSSTLEATALLQAKQKSKINDAIEHSIVNAKSSEPSTLVKEKMASIVKDKKLAAIDKNQAFNMEIYTKHQGTSELAIYMLDEYLEGNDESLIDLTKAIKQQDKITALKSLLILTQNARILAADNLIALCLQLEKAINEADDIKINDMLLVTKKELTKIKKHANSF